MSLLVLTAIEISHPYFLFTCLIRYSVARFIFSLLFFSLLRTSKKLGTREWVWVKTWNELVYAKMPGGKWSQTWQSCSNLHTHLSRLYSLFCFFYQFPQKRRPTFKKWTIFFCFCFLISYCENQIDAVWRRKCARCTPYGIYRYKKISFRCSL